MRVLILVTSMAVVACSSEPSRACTPGTTAACICSDGRNGAQSCRLDGSGYGECACTAALDDGGLLDAGIADGGLADGGTRDTGADDASVPPVCGTSAIGFALLGIDVPEAEISTAPGFNLDGLSSTGAGTSCVDLAADYISPSGEMGVDNAYASLVPTFGALLADSCPPGTPAADCVGTLLRQAQERGDFQLGIVIERLETLPNDSDVGVSLWRGRGRLDVATYELIASGAGTVVSGSLRVTFPGATPEWAPADALTGAPSTRTTLAGQLTCAGLARSTIGGAWALDDIANNAEAMEPGLGDSVRSALAGSTDLDPQAAPNDDVCDSLSWARTFDTSSPLALTSM